MKRKKLLPELCDSPTEIYSPIASILSLPQKPCTQSLNSHLPLPSNPHRSSNDQMCQTDSQDSVQSNKIINLQQQLDWAIEHNDRNEKVI